MPNVEIHGMSRYEADALRQKIFHGLEKGGVSVANVVVTHIDDSVRDIKLNPQPFLRVFTTKDTRTSEWDKIERGLTELGLDIELSLLDKFIPAKR